MERLEIDSPLSYYQNELITFQSGRPLDFWMSYYGFYDTFYRYNDTFYDFF
jgi:hypothetical protein